MSGLSVSTNYRELTTEAEIRHVAESCAKAWQDPAIPARQYELAVQSELAGFRRGQPSRPFDALVECFCRLPAEFLESRPRLLDVGASGGYARDVLEIAGFHFHYTGLDFSEPFARFAAERYPGIQWDIGDARRLPYPDGWFPIVLHGACLMHVLDYRKVIAEAARVSSRYVLFHRTPVVTDRPTVFFVKQAYGIDCLEIHFNEEELRALFLANGLRLQYTLDVFWNGTSGHRDYLVEKG